jgi:hypothetical protein
MPVRSLEINSIIEIYRGYTNNIARAILINLDLSK